MKKAIISIYSVSAILALVIGVTYAAFSDKAQILGASFSVGSADLKLLADVSGGVDGTNLVDELPGPEFANLSPGWTEDYLVKLYNNSGAEVLLTTNADYETANDTDDLRQDITVELIDWDDANSDGVADSSELGASLGAKTIVKWKTEGFDLGSLESGAVRGLVLRFRTDSVSSTKQGATGIFDFEFDSVGLE